MITSFRNMLRRYTHFSAVVTILLIAAIGSAVLLVGHAITPTFSFEAESGTPAGGSSSIVSDSTASGGKVVKFGNGQPGGGQTDNCAPNPHLCGFPDATNTGVPAGTSLTNVPSQATTGAGWHWDGDTLIIDGSSAVVSNLNVSGCVVISASNVTFKNSKISGGSGCNGVIYVAYYLNLTNITLDHLNINGNRLIGTGGGSTPGISGGYTGGTISYVNIEGTGDGIDPGDEVTIHDSWIHNQWVYTSPQGVYDHVDCIQTSGGNDLTVSHSTLDNSSGNDSPLIIGGDLGNYTNGLFTNNLLITATGEAAIRAGINRGTSLKTKNLQFLNNRIIDEAYNFVPDGTNPIKFIGNVRDSDGSAIPDFNSAGNGNTQYGG